MDLEIALEFVELAHALVKSEAGLEDRTIGEILLEIAQKAAQTYYDHMGAPLDPHLITALDTI
jgi:hypothetical protein